MESFTRTGTGRWFNSSLATLTSRVLSFNKHENPLPSWNHLRHFFFFFPLCSFSSTCRDTLLAINQILDWLFMDKCSWKGQHISSSHKKNSSKPNLMMQLRQKLQSQSKGALQRRYPAKYTDWPVPYSQSPDHQGTFTAPRLKWIQLFTDIWGRLNCCGVYLFSADVF